MSKCENCGSEMGRSKRFGARSCSDRCRKALSRRKTAVNRHFAHVDSALASIRYDVKRYPELRALVNEKLARLEADVRDLRRHDVRPGVEGVTPAVVTDSAGAICDAGERHGKEVKWI